MWIAIISGLVALVALVILLFKLKKDKLETYVIKIEQAEKQLESLFETKLSLLTQIQTIFEEREDEFELKILSDIDNDEQNSFKLNSILNKSYKKVKDFIDNKRSFIPDDETKKILDDLYNIDIECIAVKKYYNDNATILNEKRTKFLNRIISKFKHIEKKELYIDPVEEEFEILKNK